MGTSRDADLPLIAMAGAEEAKRSSSAASQGLTRGDVIAKGNARYKHGPRGYNRLKALFMAAEAMVQAWLSDLARNAALKGSGWIGPS